MACGVTCGVTCGAAGVEGVGGVGGGGFGAPGDLCSTDGHGGPGSSDNSHRSGAPEIHATALPRTTAGQQDERWMWRALDVARSAGEDVPVGAVIVGPDGAELATGVNAREALGDPTAHAEVAAIRAAVARLGDSWRLEDCTLYVTLEPCAMCAGAAVGARMGRIVFGAYEPNTGACGSVWDIPRESPLHWVQMRGGILEAECQAVLREFFARRR